MNSRAGPHRNAIIAELRANGYAGPVSVSVAALRRLHAEFMAGLASALESDTRKPPHRNAIIVELRANGYMGSVSTSVPALRALHAEHMAGVAAARGADSVPFPDGHDPDDHPPESGVPERGRGTAAAQKIHALVIAFAEIDERWGGQTNRKSIREEIYYRYQSPRWIGVPKVRGKYPLTLPWSPAAWALRDVRASDGSLVFEHVEPMRITMDRLFAHAGDFHQFEQILDAIEVVILTKSEDVSINKIGCRDRLPPGSTDPWDRYRFAGIDPSTFVTPHSL